MVKLAGLPASVLERAKVLLQKHIAYSEALIAENTRQNNTAVAQKTQQLALEDSSSVISQTYKTPDYINTLIKKIADTDINGITPLAALEILSELQKGLEEWGNKEL